MSPVLSGKIRRSIDGKSDPRAEYCAIAIVRSGLHPPRTSCAVNVGNMRAHFVLAFDPPALVIRLNPFAVGVGNDPDAISDVICTKGGSWYAVPFRIIPERGQVSENVSHPETKQAWRVFHDDEAGSNVANKTGVIAP